MIHIRPADRAQDCAILHLIRCKSDDLENIIKTGDRDRISHALKILERNWEEYSHFLKAGHSFSKVEKSRFHHLLTDSKWIPTKEKALEKPNHVFIDDQKIKDILGTSGIYLGVRIKKPDFLNSIGIHTDLNIKAVLDHLKLMVESESKDKEVYRKLYDFLSKRFDDDPDQISQALDDPRNKNLRLWKAQPNRSNLAKCW